MECWSTRSAEETENVFQEGIWEHMRNKQGRILTNTHDAGS